MIEMRGHVKESTTQQMQATSYLSGVNAGYIEELYEKFLKDPQSIEPKWRNYFASLTQANPDISHADIRAHFAKLTGRRVIGGAAAQTIGDQQHIQKQLQVNELINAYRQYGHFQAQLDPLGNNYKMQRSDLELSTYGLTQADLNTQFITNGILTQPTASLRDIEQALKKIYCGTIGFEYQHITDMQQVKWLQQRIEGKRQSLSADTKKHILESLTQAEGLERYLGVKYVGQTRFALEGGESLMPMMDEIIHRATEQKAKEIVIGMGHRGRLNILVNTCGMPISDLCLAFEGKFKEPGSGDVKYHLGFSSDVKTPAGDVHLTLAFNPSHLEIINPVIEGSVRARQARRNDESRSEVIPVLIHGDAAFAGQGVVMETFAMSQTRGFKTGGTMHIVVNNQIGFTISNPQDARSSWYCTDIAKMVESPVFHVNGDDPEAAFFVAQLAIDFRMAFKKDVVIDLVCYRRYGHNEGDEPAATQPRLYQQIKQHQTPRKLYADKLIAENVINAAESDAMATAYRDKLDNNKAIVAFSTTKKADTLGLNWEPYLNLRQDKAVDTGVAKAVLTSLAQKIETMPTGFVLQPQVAKMMEDRRKMTAGELPLNWGYAEALAYASLLNEDHPIRMSGQDAGRGTFAHRHAVVYDFEKGTSYTPLAHISKKPNAFTIIDSLLSEEAVLGFEYGYAAASPESLVIWEAQYGDFVNGAQVVIDQFICSGEQKWGRKSAVTLFLPHGYEGAGPEHSSGRLERFLQLCAEDNMQACVPSTPAQIFHLLRRQVISPVRKPLVVITPKSMLRHKLAVSTLEDLTKGRFQLLIPEVDKIDPAQTRRVVLCSGKLYYDLLDQRRTKNIQDIAIVRLEQLYPFPAAELTKELEKYKKAKEVIWCQEEPKNQGAWMPIFHELEACLAKGQTLRYVGRAAAASTATGSKYVHAEEQKTLLGEALK